MNPSYQQIRQVKPKRVVDFFPDGKLEVIKPKNKSLLKAFRRLQKAGLIKLSGKKKTRIESEYYNEVIITPQNIVNELRGRQIDLLKETYYTDSKFVLLCGRDYQLVFNEFIVKSPLQMRYDTDPIKMGPKLIGITLGFTTEIQGSLLLPARFIKDLAAKI